MQSPPTLIGIIAGLIAEILGLAKGFNASQLEAARRSARDRYDRKTDRLVDKLERAEKAVTSQAEAIVDKAEAKIRKELDRLAEIAGGTLLSHEKASILDETVGGVKQVVGDGFTKS